MRTISLTLICGAALILTSGCGSPSATNNSNTTANSGNMSTTRAAGSGGLPPISSAHDGNSMGAPVAPTTTGNTIKPTGIDTAALDVKIEKAEAKAKAAGAAQADKTVVAAALIQRANVYRDAGQPALYKFALGDYRRALRYQPDNAEAREKMNEIVSIYQSMGRPVPENGNEP